jgi:gamma-glutamyltranspeptidase/glutathione hydrolase
MKRPITKTRRLALTIGFLFAGHAVADIEDPRHPLLNQGPKAEAVADSAMVSTQLAQVTDAAVAVLQAGGNAFDAFITAVFLQHVVDYHQVSHFGALGALIYDAASKEYIALDAYSERPVGDDCAPGTNPAEVAIGGTVRGLEALWRRYGTLDWADYLEPAIRAAEEGVVVTSYMYGINYADWLAQTYIRRNAQAAAHFLPDGHLVPVGERWKMPQLAKTLRGVQREGADYLYTGEWGQKFVKAANDRGYCVTLDDMAAYTVRWVEPVRSSYRGLDIIGEPPPKKGGTQIPYNLNVLENFDMAALGNYAESPEALEILIRSLAVVDADIRYAIQDPLNLQVPTGVLLSKDYAKMRAEIVSQSRVQDGVDLGPAMRWARGEGTSIDVSRLTPKNDAEGRSQTDDSDHNVIVDASGNWISGLHTMHGGAPGLFIDGVRAIGSTFFAYTTGPGRRVSSNSTGIIVADEQGPWLSLGSPGSPPQPVTQVLVSVIDNQVPPRDAVALPRFHAYQNDEQIVLIESGISDAVRRGIAAAGIPMRELGTFDWQMGSMQLIWRNRETGKLHGVTDPRRLGHAAGY